MKKILLIIALVLCMFQMIVLATAIDIGSAATNRSSNLAYQTIVNKINPANLSGKITSVQIYSYNDMVDTTVATFSASGNDMTTRDSEFIGTVFDDATRTFIVDLNVEAGDYIGVHFTSGSIDVTAVGEGYWYKAGDYIPCTGETFSSNTSATLSLYGTGETVEAGIKWNGVTITKWNGITITIPLNTQ